MVRDQKQTQIPVSVHITTANFLLNSLVSSTQLFPSLAARCDSGGGVSFRQLQVQGTNNVSSDGEITDRKLNERQAVFALVCSQSERTFKCGRNVSHLPQAQAFHGTNNGDIVLKGKEER